MLCKDSQDERTTDRPVLRMLFMSMLMMMLLMLLIMLLTWSVLRRNVDIITGRCGCAIVADDVAGGVVV